MGDGNLHLNVINPDKSSENGSQVFEPALLAAIEPWLWEAVAELGGSVSAEHGIGAEKPDALHYSKKGDAIRLMRSVKNLFDPNAILNPYKVFTAVG
jgi:D-2-hydroxyglutarate dehydrogenase